MEAASKISFHQQHQLSFVGWHHISSDCRFDLVHRHDVGTLGALLLLGLGQEGVELCGHAGDGDHVAVGDHGVGRGTAVLGRVPGKVLRIPQGFPPSRHLHGPQCQQVGNDNVGGLTRNVDQGVIQLLREVAWREMI